MKGTPAPADFNTAYASPDRDVQYPSTHHTYIPSVQEQTNTAFHHSPPAGGLSYPNTRDTVDTSKPQTLETLQNKIPDTIGGYKVPDAIKNAQLPEAVKNMQVPEALKNVQVPPAVQNAANVTQAHVQNAANVTQAEYRKTADELNQLGARVPGPSSEHKPEQYITHFHNFFYDLFTWKFPRATGISFAAALSLIITSGYVNILRYVFKAMYLLFAASAVAEFAGKPLGMQGFVSQIRPKHYAIIPRDALESVFAEIHELVNFFVLEFQRLLFAENIFATIVAFVASFIGYVAIKYISAWTLIFISTITAFTAPLIYLQNQEVIDAKLHEVNQIVNEKLTVARNTTEKYATEAANQAKATAAQLQERAFELTGQAKQSVNAAIPKVQEAANNAAQTAQQTYNNATQSTINATKLASEKVRGVTGSVANAPASSPAPVNVIPHREPEDVTAHTHADSVLNRQYRESDFPEPPHKVQRVQPEHISDTPVHKEMEDPMAY